MLKTAWTAARHLKRSSSGMFKPLGLLSGYQCSDSPCRRLHCFFNHGESSKAPQIQRDSKRKAPDISAEVSVKRHTHSLAGNPAKVVPPRQGVAAKVQPAAKARPISPTRVEIGARGTPSSVISGSKSSAAVRPTGVISKPQTTPRPGPAKPTSVLSGSPSVKGHLEPPSVPKNNLQLSPQPWTDRQKALQTIFGQYTKLFAAVLPSAPDLAHTTSLAEEAEISATSSANLRVYKTAIHQAAVSISRRPPPDTLTHPSVGTIKQSRLKHEAIATIKASKPSRDRIEQYCLSTEELIEWGFPNPTDENLVTNGGEEPDLEGSSQKCHRCKVLFVVDSKNLESRMGECSHHYGKLRPERVEGMRKWLYTCCKRERGGAGCEDGVHAFREEDDFYLHRRKGFRRVNQITSKGSGWLDVVAMDCEMVSTTSGSSLARVTIVDEDGGILLDELVRQTVPVLDLNTRFSGVTPGQLESAVMDLEAVRSAACVFIGPDTIIVGHGLENDLRALRLMHDKVIDTAVLFPHDKGKPFRRPLRDIVKETLGYFIQDRTADLGHSSAEDAKATLDVLKWKVRTE